MRPELILWDWNGTLLDDVDPQLPELDAGDPRLPPAVRPRAVPGDFWLPRRGFLRPRRVRLHPPQLCRVGGKLHGGLHPGQRRLSADGRGR